MSECGIRPEHALGRDAITGLPEIHGDGPAEKVLDLVAVGVSGDPAGPADGYAPEDECGDMEDRDMVEVGRKEACEVLLVADEEYARDDALEVGDGGLGEVKVRMRARISVVVCMVGV